MRIKLAYTGRFVSYRNKISYGYIVVNSKKKMVFDKKLHPLLIVGNILEVTETKDGVKPPYEIKGKLDDEDQINIWRNNDRLEYDKYLLTKEQTKKENTAYDYAIIDLKRLYKNTSPSNKQLFINRLIREITK